MSRPTESLDGRIGLHPDPTNPDSIMQSDLRQVPLDQWDAPSVEILGRCEGKALNSIHIEIQTESGKTIRLSIPEQTQFVRVLREDGTEWMETYNPQRHGEWERIRDTELTPEELLKQLSGFGTQKMDQGQQFQIVRKARGGASRGHWEVGRHPKPKMITRK